MNKIQIKWIAICLPLIVLFNIFFYILGWNRPVASVWISYAFVHLAFGILIVAPFIKAKGQDKHLYRETTSLIAGLYFLIQLAVGILFILFKPQSWVLPLSIQLVLIVMSIIVLTINILSNAHSSSVEQQRKETQKIFKSAVNALTQATSKSDENDRKYIQTLLIDLKTSPLTASETLSGLGNNILSESLAILQAAEDSDSNGIHAHGSVLSQLLSLRKQNPC